MVGTPRHLSLSVAAILPLLAQLLVAAVAGQKYVYTAVYSTNTLCPLISMMSYYCNGYCRGCIRLLEAVRGHAQLNTAVKESRMLKIV